MLRLLRKGYQPRASLEVENSLERKKSWNVVAELEGRERPEEQLIVSSHYDSWDLGPGAFDDASGTVVLLDVARALARHRNCLKRTVKFVAFSVEEIGCGGSYAYVRLHEEELDKIAFMMDLELPGSPSGYSASDEALARALQEPASRLGYSISLAGRPGGIYSDSSVFALKGIQRVGLTLKPQEPPASLFGHTQADTPDKLSIEALKDCAAAIGHLLFHALSLPELPVRRLCEPDVCRLYEASGLASLLRILRAWPFQP
jgi:Zn-dependent M28 family amino/carboxypeptidase